MNGQIMPQPIGWIYEDDEGRMMFSQMAPTGMFWEPVYRAAPKREWQGLTDDEIDDIWNEFCDERGYASISDAEDIARAIEAKLREKNG